MANSRPSRCSLRKRGAEAAVVHMRRRSSAGRRWNEGNVAAELPLKFENLSLKMEYGTRLSLGLGSGCVSDTVSLGLLIIKSNRL